jgi:hypothetical protein
MKTHVIAKSGASVIGTFIWIGILCLGTFAWNPSGSRNGSAAHSGGSARGYSGGHSGGSHSYGGHYYRGGHYGRSGIDVTVVEPPPYYYYDGYDYPPDYTVIAPASVAQVVESPQPAAAESAGPVRINSYQPATADTVIIGVPNSEGGFTSVKLTRRADGYIGPQGEFYAGHPTIEQLKVLYGS